MSDEQKMPIDRLDTELISAGEDMWMIEEVKRDDGPYVLYADHLATIAALTAERDALRAKVRECLNECRIFHGDSMDIDQYMTDDLAALAQLKEQNNE